jgi:hypothetical protein
VGSIDRVSFVIFAVPTDGTYVVCERAAISGDGRFATTPGAPKFAPVNKFQAAPYLPSKQGDR